jgi:molecular chaperone GrpE
MLKRSKNGNEQSDPFAENPPSEESVDASATGKSAADSEAQPETAKLQAEIADLKDKYLRTLAESENARKRIRQQSEESVRLQRENFLRDLLPIVDNLERAVDAAHKGGDGRSIVEGVELVLRGLLDFLKSHGVTQLHAVGQPFDPQRHEAVDQIESANHPPNTVLTELHRGYQIGERTLRPASVTVTKAPGQNSRRGNSDDDTQVENG